MQYGELKGVLWHQGESDSSKYKEYMTKLVTMINALRADLNTPDLAFVAGQLSNDKPHRSDFNKMIMELPKHTDNASVITTENTSTIDSTHFDAASQRLLGERYAKKMILYIDKGYMLPLVIKVYDGKGLYEQYAYTKFILNPDFEDDEFTSEYKDYGF